MKTIYAAALLLLCSAAGARPLQQTQEPVSFQQVAGDAEQRLADSLRELSRLRSEIAEEKIPLSRRLSELDSDLTRIRAEFQETTRRLDSRTLDLTNLQGELESREEEAAYLSSLLGEYVRGFESGLHIVEVQRYEEALSTAKLALENRGLSQSEVFDAQLNLADVSIDRMFDALGGTRFEGTAVVDDGTLERGTYLMVGPAAIFTRPNSEVTGTAEQRLGSLEPTLVAFGQLPDAVAGKTLIDEGTGFFPVDPTLGNAHKIEATNETLIEHVKKGGPVMIPIFAMAAAALLVALYKWLALLFLPRPSSKQVAGLMAAVEADDEAEATARAAELRGPMGKMLAAGVEHIREPRQLVEEVMYEIVLTTRLKLQSWLPFVAICAASAPLLGLLGTVTGIINTFKLITVFGSGDVKSLSGGISEALITTKFGLIVAIPSLLLHAFLSRKARSLMNQMEKSAISFMNHVAKTKPAAWSEPPGPGELVDPEPVGGNPALRRQVKEVLGEILTPLTQPTVVPAVEQASNANPPARGDT